MGSFWMSVSRSIGYPDLNIYLIKYQKINRLVYTGVAFSNFHSHLHVNQFDPLWVEKKVWSWILSTLRVPEPVCIRFVPKERKLCVKIEQTNELAPFGFQSKRQKLVSTDFNRVWPSWFHFGGRNQCDDDEYELLRSSLSRMICTHQSPSEENVRAR